MNRQNIMSARPVIFSMQFWVTGLVLLTLLMFFVTYQFVSWAEEVEKAGQQRERSCGLATKTCDGHLANGIGVIVEMATTLN